MIAGAVPRVLEEEGVGAEVRTTSVVVSYNKLGLPDCKYVCNKPESNFLQVEQSTLNFMNSWGLG